MNLNTYSTRTPTKRLVSIHTHGVQAFMVCIRPNTYQQPSNPKIYITILVRGLSAYHSCCHHHQPSRAQVPRPAATVRMSGDTTTEKAWTARGMTVEDFYTNSIGSWRSLRSSHNIAFAQLEEVNSEIDITTVDQDDEELIQVRERR